MVLSCALVLQKRIFSPILSQYNQSSILFEPPKPLKYMFYRCDVKFHLDTILDMYEDDDYYGLCLISGEDLVIYLVTISSDNRIDIKKLNSENIELQTRTRRGGSSSGRYGRINDKAKNYNKILFTELIINAYMYENHTKCKIKKLILAGPTDMKKEITDTSLFQQHLQKYLFKIVNTNGIHQTTADEVMGNILGEIKYADVKQVDNEIEKLVQYQYDSLLIGKTECEEFIKENNIKKLYICKSGIQYNEEVLSIIDNLKTIIPVIFSESTILKTYGGWVGIKKY